MTICIRKIFWEKNKLKDFKDFFKVHKNEKINKETRSYLRREK